MMLPPASLLCLQIPIPIRICIRIRINVWQNKQNGCLDSLPPTDPQRRAVGGLVPRLPCSKLQHSLQKVNT